jgi:hypothetical protein
MLSMRRFTLSILLLVLSTLVGCAELPARGPVSLLPTEKLPTIIALTLEAQGVHTNVTEPPASTNPKITIPSESTKSTSIATATVNVTAPPSETSPPTTVATATIRPSNTPRPTTITPSLSPLGPSEPTHTPAPLIPDASIQIYWIGERSKVVSPLQVIARLTSRVGKIVRIELYGEDGRLLARHVKTYNNLPWHVAGLNVELPFEIPAAAEEGRLVVSAEDIHGRLVDLNSISVILLSQGETELNPTTALWQRIVIQEPAADNLIQGGTVVVTGLVKPNGDQPLNVSLVAEDGRVLGQRLAGVNFTKSGDYGSFLAEVPYTVSEATPVRLIVSEDGGQISPIAHLSSVEIVLSP